jgi:hypothetical protein
VPVSIMLRDADFEPADGASNLSLTLYPVGGGPPAVLDKLAWRKPADTGAKTTGILATELDAPSPGVYLIEAAAEIPGVGRVTDSLGLAVSETDIERANPLVQRELVTRMASVTGGRVVTAAEAGGLAAGILREPVFKRLFEHWELLYNWPTLAAVLVLLFTEWALRKRWGAA